MDIQQKTKIYLPSEMTFSYEKKCNNGIIIKTTILLGTEKFVDYQKDLIQDFITELSDDINDEDSVEIETRVIKKKMEQSLQKLNTQLITFAEKIKNIDHFSLRGIVQVVVDQTYMASMIGDVSLLIMRDKKLNYTLTNGMDKKTKIDLFSDFVEGDIERGDEIIFVGMPIENILDSNDIEELNEVLESENNNTLSIIEEMLTARADKNDIGGFVYEIVGKEKGLSNKVSKFSQTKKYDSLKQSLGSKTKIFDGIGESVIKNRYPVMITIFLCIIAFLTYNLVSRILTSDMSNVLIDEQGNTVAITIQDIKRELSLFQRIDPSSDEKMTSYQKILSQLQLLEQNGKRPNDVAELKKILQAEYNKGFNIVYFNNINQLNSDTTNSGIPQFYLFSAQEKQSFGDLRQLFFEKELYVVGTRGALVRAINNDIRGSIIDMNTPSEIKTCTLDLSRNGLYCITQDQSLYHIGRAGFESLSQRNGENFPQTIDRLGIFGKSTFFAFANEQALNESGIFLYRFQNVLGSITQFQSPQLYFFEPKVLSGRTWGNFSSISIDTTFLARSTKDGSLYQIRRPGGGNNVNIRKVPMFGGDRIGDTYSDQLRVITYQNTKYVYLFDPVNQTFTAYESKAPKTNDSASTNYSLHYLFRFKFDLGPQKVIDVNIPAIGDKPELYILTNEGVYKLQLFNFIESIAESRILPDNQ